MAFLLSLSLVVLYVVPLVTTVPATGLFAVSLIVAIAAGVVAIASVVGYILAPKMKHQWMTGVVSGIFGLATGYLIFDTGGLESPFIALWTLVAFFSGIYAIWGVLAILVTSGVFIAYVYLEGMLDIASFALVGFLSLIPALISLMVWHHRDTVDESTKNVRKLSTELSEVAQKAEIIINAIGDGVIAVDSTGVISLINPAGQEILGWAKQDAVMLNYKSVLKMFDADNHDLDPSQDPVAQVLNTNQQVRSNTIQVQTKSGKKMMASLTVSPIGQAGSGVIIVFRDITKEKAEEREQAEFISTASHEMRTPVASIEGYLGLVMNPNTATIDQRAQGYIQKAHESAQHLGRLFQDLLDVSKSEDGRMTNIPKVVDLSAYTESIVQGLQPKAVEKNLTLTFVPASQRAQKTITPVYFVNQDNDHIREIIDNLVENAIKYTPSGTVTVDVTGTDDKVVVSVKDSGLGIPAEDIPHLFQKFYRVDNADRQAIGGTGLGLYLSRRLAEAMQGRLWVESVHGQGSTFFFELPRITNEEAERAKIQQANRPTKPAATPQAFAPAPAPTTAVPSVQTMEPVLPKSAQPPSSSAPATIVNTPAQPQQPPTPSAPPDPNPQQQTSPPTNPTVKPATTVPRGDSLTREQINERVRQLEEMAKANRTVNPRQTTP